VTTPVQRPAEPRGSWVPTVRPHFTGRAAVLAIVLCGIALSLAYPVREYISQRRQIDQLLAQSDRITLHRKQLEAEDRQLHSPAYIAEQARDRLHMCLPTQMCYEIIGTSRKPKSIASTVAVSPWYGRMWSSVQQANVRQPSKRGVTSKTSDLRSGRSRRAGRTRSAGRAHGR
jgi:cell division protein FtsB